MGKFEEFTSQADAIAGATWFFEELLIRGEPNGQSGGQTKGAHVVLGIAYADPFGKQAVKLSDPIPVGDIPENAGLDQIMPRAAAAMQSANDALKLQLASVMAERDTLQATSAKTLSALEATQADLAKAAATIGDLQAQNADLTTRLARLSDGVRTLVSTNAL